VTEGQLAARCGATAMIDVSDGLAIDLHRLADASRVGFAIDEVPVSIGATLDEAIAGGEDYELLFAAPAAAAITTAFSEAGLAVPTRIGSVLADSGSRTCMGENLPAIGWQHDLGEHEVE
jgi:thiamine-monophosphate kinase